MQDAESTQTRFARSALLALAFLAGAIAFWQSYGAWLHPFIDAGRDLYIPEQIRSGTKLYTDILYFYPPLTPYLLAAITMVTGSGLSAYLAIGFGIAALTAWTLWSIAHRTAGAFAASCVLLLFFAFSMCGVSGWGSNYFFPYAHAATLAMLFFLGGAAMLLRQRYAIAVALLVAASWTKLEYCVFAAALVLLFATWKWIAVYAASMLITIGAAAAYFGPANLRENILPPSLLGGTYARTFYAKVTGAADFAPNLLLSLRGAVFLGAFVLLLWGWKRWPRWLIVTALAILTLALANDFFFRGWSVLQLILIPFAIRERKKPLALLLFLSLCASSRIYLNLVPTWYGFVFILPVELLVAYVLFEWLPSRAVYSRKAALGWIPLFVLVAASGLYSAHRNFASKTAVVTKRGTYYDTSATRAAAVTELLKRLEGTRTLVVMPEGLALNYLSGVRTPLRVQTFTPVEIAGHETEVAKELLEKRPQYVILVPRDMSEFGSRGLGFDYGQEIIGVLRGNYYLEERIGDLLLMRSIRTLP